MIYTGDCIVCKGLVLPGPIELKSYNIEDTSKYYSKILKEQGNELFNLKKYNDAIMMFNHAIRLYDKDVTYYSNRRYICHYFT